MAIDLNSEASPIDPNEAKYTPLLANLQGNILKSHGRNFAAHLFVTFTADADQSRRWIADFTARYITSAYRQHYEAKEFNVNKVSGRVFGGLYLSAAGYKALGYADLNGFVEDNETNSPVEVYFKDGMAMNGEDELNDPPSNEWDAAFRDNEIHALVLLADDAAERLRDVTERVRKSLEAAAENTFIQNGAVLRENGKPIEPFGFRDGISQTLFYLDDVEKERAKGFDRWDSAAALKLVLVKDVLAAEEDSFGSYLVYRKLEQNVKAFKEAELELAGADYLNLADDEKERAGALIVGRFRNGVPIELSATGTEADLIDFNNFNFLDADGQPTVTKCPYHAHIRRATPRGAAGLENGKIKEDEELCHRLVRRGITYDDREKDGDGNLLTNGEPETDVGLLFMCFQSSIPKQFGFVQARWANVTTFFGGVQSGVDPIAGQNTDLQAIEYQKWYPKWGDAEQPKDFNFKTFVKLKGGEYFFAPSISFLKNLGG